jgi:hypothetical protein
MDKWELYDITADPSEMNNIYENASNELILNLKKELKSLQIQYQDSVSIEEMKLMTDTVISRLYNEPNKNK